MLAGTWVWPSGMWVWAGEGVNRAGGVLGLGWQRCRSGQWVGWGYSPPVPGCRKEGAGRGRGCRQRTPAPARGLVFGGGGRGPEALRIRNILGAMAENLPCRLPRGMWWVRPPGQFRVQMEQPSASHGCSKNSSLLPMPGAQSSALSRSFPNFRWGFSCGAAQWGILTVAVLCQVSPGPGCPEGAGQWPWGHPSPPPQPVPLGHSCELQHVSPVPTECHQTLTGHTHLTARCQETKALAS